MKEVIISLAIGVSAAAIAYLLQGLGKSKSRSSEKPQTGISSNKPKTLQEEPVEVPQTAVPTERLIPKKEWTGGHR